MFLPKQYGEPEKRASKVLWLAILLVLLGGLFGAKPAYRKIKLWRAGNFSTQAERFLEQKQWKEAQQKAEAALGLNPTDVRSLRVIARILTLARSEQALSFWKQILSVPGGKSSDRTEMIKLALMLNRIEVARKELEIALKEKPPESETLRLAAEFCSLGGDTLKAIQFAGMFLEKETNSIPVKLFLARHLLKVPGDGMQAGKDLLWQLAEDGGDGRLEAVRMLAGLELSVRELERSIELLNKAAPNSEGDFLRAHLSIRAHPETQKQVIESMLAKYRNTGGTQLLELGRWLCREKEFQRALDVIPRDLALQTNRFLLIHLDALAQLHKWEAIDEILAMPKIPLEDLYAELYRARTARELKRDKMARSIWERVLTMAADDPGQLAYAANYAFLSGETDSARRAYERLRNISPNPRAAYEKLIQLTDTERDTKTLQKLLREMVERYPDDPTPRNDLAYINLLLNTEVEAAKQVATDLFKQNRQIMAYRATLALAHLRTNDPTTARLLFEQAPNFEFAAMQPGWQAIYVAALPANRSGTAKALARQIAVDRLKPEERKLVQPLL